MGVSKVVYNGQVLVDLTGDTVTADSLAQGVTAHDAAGNEITGTVQPTKIATNSTLGIVKGGGNVYIRDDGTMYISEEIGIEALSAEELDALLV